MYMEKLPPSINKYIFRFLSHPVADAIRDRISEFQDLNSQYESVSELHTFYIFFFCDMHGHSVKKNVFMYGNS